MLVCKPRQGDPVRFPHASAHTRVADAKLSLGHAHSSVWGWFCSDKAVMGHMLRDYLFKFNIKYLFISNLKIILQFHILTLLFIMI